jgi:transposase, IS30 family
MRYHHLTTDARCQIYTLKSMGKSQKDIAKHLGVSASSISRELKRNAGKRGYRYKQADEMATQRRSEASSRPTRMIPHVVTEIEAMLLKEWSPEQISGRLKLSDISVSHETIYAHVWANKKAGGTLYKSLRHAGKKYYRRSSGKSGRGCIPNRADIKDRPAIIETKQRLGDWEGDTIIGAKHKGVIVSAVDRKTKYTKLVKSEDKTAESVTQAVKRAFTNIPAKAIRSITFDNGLEFSMHETITKQTGLACYFATPYHSWERGLNEHTNGLVRQYLPKSCNLSAVTDEQLQFVEDRLNNRPRKVLGYRTPREAFLDKRPQRIALQG